MTKKCKKCELVLPLDGFHKDRKSKDGHSFYCKECNKAKAKSWYGENREKRRAYDKAYNAENREAIRNYNLQYKFGVTLDEYESILASQGNVCGICGCDADPIVGRAMPLDHDHVTGAPRGVLCSSCNRGIGLLGDDPDRLVAAAAYLLQFTSVLPRSL